MKERIGIFYLNFDGFASMYCGVGAVAQYFIYSIPQIRLRLLDKNFEAFFHLIFPEVSKSSNCYSKLIFQRTLRMLSAMSTFVTTHSVSHGRQVATPFGTPRTWKTVSEHAAQTIIKYGSKYDRCVVLSNDAPFAAVGNALRPYLDPNRFTLVWLPHSTTKLYPDQLDQLDNLRLVEEHAILELCKSSANCYVGATSQFMTKHLQDEWGLNRECILDYRVGISPKYLHTHYKISQKEIEGKLDALGVPKNSKLALLFGRADFHKGIDLGFELLTNLAENHSIFPIILTSNFGTKYSREVLNKLKAKINFWGKGVFLSVYHFDLPKFILQSRRLSFVLVPSRNENLSLIPSEFRTLNKFNGVVIVSNTGGLSEQINNGVDGFKVNMYDLPEAISTCKKVLSLPESQRREINLNGLKTVNENYDLQQNMTGSLLSTLEMRKHE